MRLAANHALDRQAINQAETLGFSKINWSIIPSSFEFYWQPPAVPYDPASAKAAPRRGGLPRAGSTAASYSCDAAYAQIGEAVVNYLQRRRHPRQAPAARARGVLQGYGDKKLQGR